MSKYGREGFRLTGRADIDAADYIENFKGCSCHISTPCSSCTHPGNPMNLAEDDTAWEVDPAWISAGHTSRLLISRFIDRFRNA